MLLHTVVIRLKSVLFALILASSGFAQTNDPGGHFVSPSTTGDSNGWDGIFKLIGPVPADEQAHAERPHEFLLNTLGPVPLLGEAAGAGISQWMGAPKEWGQGWGAFGKRYGSNLAYNGIRQSITYGGSALLGEDNRYFASSANGFWSRTKHALVSTFTARHTDGRDSFSFSGTVGVLGASALSSLWGPESWKGTGNIGKNAGISFASTAACNIVREFLPDVFHRARN